MSKLFDSFWRATLYCLHPRVLLLSLLPLLIMAVLAWGLAYFFWNHAVATLRATLESYALVNTLVQWLEGWGLSSLHSALSPAVLLLLVIPVIVIGSLFCVAVLMTPTLVSWVAKRRFPQLERKKGGSLGGSILWSLGSAVLAVVALLLSMPLWLVPPLVLILPPLIWGWLTYRVMAYDALADHASPEERRHIIKKNRRALLAIGVLSAYLGAAPSLVWASGALFVLMAPILVPVAIWMYALVFAFSSLWFTHYLLSALEQFRQENKAVALENNENNAIKKIASEL